MFIKDLTIKNFRCFKNLQLKNLPKLIVIIGENNAGKSTFLEALRYIFIESKKVDSTLGKSLGKIEGKENLWFRGETEKPIEISLTLKENFKRDDLPTEFKESLQKGTFSISFTIEKENEELKAKWKEINNLSSQEKGFSNFFSQLKEMKLENKFKLIPAVRESSEKEEGIGERNSIIPYEIQSKIKELSKKRINPKESRKWWKFKDIIDLITQLPLEGGYQISVIKEIHGEKINLPIEACGGGYQAFVQLCYEVCHFDGTEIIALEEPENHLHPKWIKKLMDLIKERSKHGPQFVITTHSPFVVNKVPIENIYYAFQENGEGKIKKISEKEEIGKALFQIGIQPSDILFPNAILLVEGDADAKFFSYFLEEFSEIKIIPCKGADKEPGHYEFWAEITQNIEIPKFAILDKNKAEVKEKLKAKGLDEKNIFVLEKGDLEDYYPRELIKEFLKEKGEEIGEEIPVGKTVEILNKYFGEKWWKYELADFVVSRIEKSKIDEEIKKIINIITSSLKEKENWSILSPRGNWKMGK